MTLEYVLHPASPLRNGRGIEEQSQILRSDDEQQGHLCLKTTDSIFLQCHILTFTMVYIPKLFAGCHSPRFTGPLPLRDTKLNEFGECFREAMFGSKTASKIFITVRHSLVKELLFVICIDVNVFLEGFVLDERHIRTV